LDKLPLWRTGIYRFESSCEDCTCLADFRRDIATVKYCQGQEVPTPQ